MKNSIISFYTSYSEKTSINADKLWKVWKDVNQWPIWDKGLQSTQLLTTFSSGGKFLLTPVGSPVAIEIELRDVIENKKFIEFARLPFGTIEVCNEMVSENNMTTITHRISASIEESQAEHFRETMWKSIEEGLPSSIKGAISLAATFK
jgi:hypothetical protein